MHTRWSDDRADAVLTFLCFMLLCRRMETINGNNGIEFALRLICVRPRPSLNGRQCARCCRLITSSVGMVHVHRWEYMAKQRAQPCTYQNECTQKSRVWWPILYSFFIHSFDYTGHTTPINNYVGTRYWPVLSTHCTVHTHRETRTHTVALAAHIGFHLINGHPYMLVCVHSWNSSPRWRTTEAWTSWWIHTYVLRDKCFISHFHSDRT